MTIFGQSAGAAMVSALAISPTISTDLFQRVITQSGSVFASWTYSLSPVDDAINIAQRAGFTSSRMSIAQLNRAFMNMDLVDLLNATEIHEVDFIEEKKLYV